MKVFAVAAFAAILVPSFAVQADAGREPTPQERAEIVEVLRQVGVTQWDDIELKDHGTNWKIDDAIGPDGREYDLKLRASTLEPVDAKLD